LEFVGNDRQLVLVANAGVPNSAVTKFIASNRFRCDCVSNVSFAVFGFALIFGLVARTILWSITTANSRETDYQN